MPELKDTLDTFKVFAEADRKQRQRELEDLRFARGWQEDQWPGEIITARKGDTAGVAPKPCLTINKLRQPLQQVSNQARSARFSIHFAPNSDDADPLIAEIFEDAVRAIQVESRAHVARQWAFDRATRCGRGWYRILTEYTGEESFDLSICYKRILNQACVYPDPHASEPDGSDSEELFITEDIPYETFKRQYGESVLAKAIDDHELMSIGDDQPGWVSGEKGARLIRVAEHFYVEYTTETLLKVAGQVIAKSQIPKDAPPIPEEMIEESRTVTRRQVKWEKITCADVLETRDVDGQYIPVIQVIADEEMVGDEHSWQGLIGPAKDAQRMYNYMASAQAETIGLAPKAPYIGYEGQFEGHETKWNSVNVRNWAYLEAKPSTLLSPPGQVLPLPQRNIQEPAIQAITLAKQSATEDIHVTTGIPPVALGQIDPHDRSGRAIAALQAVSEQTSSGYLDNLVSISMLHEGRILRDLIPIVLMNRPGRILQLMGADDERRAVMLGQPFVMQNGKPIAVPPGTEGARTIDLRQGTYTVSVKVGKSYTTKREQGAAAMGDLIESAPQLIGVLGDLYVGELDFPGAKQAADRLKKMLPPQLQEQQQNPEQMIPVLQQQLQQATEMLQMLQQKVAEQQQIIQTEAVKAQSQQQIEALRAASDERVAALNNETKIAIEQMKAQQGEYQHTMSETLEGIRLVLAQQHELRMQERDHLAAQAAEPSNGQGA